MFLFISERHSNPCGKLLIHVAALLPKSCVCVCVCVCVSLPQPHAGSDVNPSVLKKALCILDTL